ncbi:cytochrome P450 CYP72A219-like [Nymphaea colorata]|nr:cytochrome P450 CYP72A219-like [Nymphaea colorata]
MEMVGSMMSVRTLVVRVLPGFLLAWAVWKVLYEVWWKPWRIQSWLNKQGIHGPSFQLFFGNARETMSMFFEAWSKPMSLCHDIAPRVLPFFDHVVKKYGKMCVVWYGNIPVVIVSSPDLVKEVLTNRSGEFVKAPPPPSMRSIVTGIIIREGENWAAHRKILNPAFHLEQLKGLLPTFSFSCSELLNKWDKSVAASGSCELDVFAELQTLTENVISKLVFGRNHLEGKRLFEIQKEQAEMAFKALWKIQLPGFRFVPTKENIRAKKLNDELTRILQDMIRKRIKEMKTEDARNGDLLAMLLEAYMIDNDPEEPGSFKKIGISRDDVVEECKLFYFAGQGTTAVLLTWTMVVLSMHPEWQTRARDEVLRTCGNEIPTFDHLNQLKIVTMVLCEVLRLYPPVVMLARHASKTMKVGNFEIPAGVQLLLPTLLIQHDPELWGDDSKEFKPERFAEGAANASKHQLGFFPFSWGPRVCIGQNFTMVEAKLVLAMILQQFSFELSPCYSHAPSPVLTLQPQHGAHLILHKI